MAGKKYIYTVTDTVNSVTYTLTDIADSATLSILHPLCNTDLKSGKGTLQITLKPGDKTFWVTFIQALLTARQSGEIDKWLVVATDPDTNKAVFRGYVDNSELQISSKKIPNNIVLSAMDKSVLLDKKVRYNHYWENDARNTILTALFTALQADIQPMVLPSILSTDLANTSVIDYFCVADGKDETYREVIDRILYEAKGYVLWYDAEYDGFRVKQIPDNTFVATRTVSYLINDSLVTKNAIYDHDGILLSFPTYAEKDDVNLYTENISVSLDEDGKVVGIEIPNGEYFPTDGDIKAIYQAYVADGLDRAYLTKESRLKNDDISLLYGKNVSASLASNPPLINENNPLPNIKWTGTPQTYPDRAWFLYKNTSGESSNVTAFTLTGTAVYVAAVNKMTIPGACTAPEEMEVTTITDSAEAEAFGVWIYNMKKYGKTISTWSDLLGTSYIGEVVNVVHTDTGISMPHVIVQITDAAASNDTTVRKQKIVALSLYGWSAVSAGVLESESTSQAAVRLVKTKPQYYMSRSLDSLIPNCFVKTQDATWDSDKTYYVFDIETGFTEATGGSFTPGVQYYEATSWMDFIVYSTGGNYYLNGGLTPTRDASWDNDKAYYEWDSVAEEYVVSTDGQFFPGKVYYEWQDFPSYVWHRQEYIYSNGSVNYSAQAYYLQTADVAMPFVITTQYGISTDNEFVPTQDATPVVGKEYYAKNADNAWIYLDTVNGQFPVDITIYEIASFVGWNDVIPSSWKSGLYVWKKETILYENKPDESIIQIPVYSEYATNQMEATCVFEVMPSAYGWTKNKRIPQNSNLVTIDLVYNIVGYGTTITPVISGNPVGVTVAADGKSISFYSDIDAESITLTIGMSEYPYVQSETFTIVSSDVTENPMFLGSFSELPNMQNTGIQVFLDGDHFVASQTFVDGGVTYTQYMPYVRMSSLWIPVDGNVEKYGNTLTDQILQNCARAIYANATYIYTQCSAGDTAQAGIDYFTINSDNEYEGVPVQVGADVSSYYTRALNLPSVLNEYYRYQLGIQMSYLKVNDIQLMSEQDPQTGVISTGKIRSAGYAKGTVDTIIKTAKAGNSIEGFQKGFYGDAEGNFEAFQAWLYQASIYNANIVGELRNDLFMTQLESDKGEDYFLNPLADESWSGTEALNKIKTALANAGIGDNGLNEIVQMACHYPTNGNLYSYAMLIEDTSPNNIKSVVKTHGQTWTAPIKTNVTVTDGLWYDSSNNVFAGGLVSKGTVLTNKDRWLLSQMMTNLSMSDNVIKPVTSGSWNSSSFSACARVTNTGATALDTGTKTGSCTYNVGLTQTYTVPTSYGKQRKVKISGQCCGVVSHVLFSYYHSRGSVVIKVNNSTVWSQGQVQGSNSEPSWGFDTGDFTVNAGDVITIQLNPYDDRNLDRYYNGNYTLTLYSETFSSTGLIYNGLWTWDGSSWTSRGNATDFLQANDNCTVSSPSFNSANYLLNASLAYDFSQYEVGLNLLNSNGVRQQTVVSGPHLVSEVFDAVYIGTVLYNSPTETHYCHYNGLWKYAKCPIPLTSFSSGVTYYEYNSGQGTYVVTADSTPNQSKQYYYKDENIPEGTVYSLDSANFSYKKFGDVRHPSSGYFTDASAIIWNSGQLVVEGSTEISVIKTTDWVSELTLNFTTLSRERGNYTGTLFPMETEQQRVTDIDLGSEDRPFDHVFANDVGTIAKPVNNINTQNLGTLVSVLGSSLGGSFNPLLVYYELTGGVYVKTTDSTPVSNKTYYNIYPTTNAYIENLWEVTNTQAKLIKDLYVKVSQVEQSISGSASMIPSSKAVNDALTNITESFIPVGTPYYSEHSTWTNILGYTDRLITRQDVGGYYITDASGGVKEWSYIYGYPIGTQYDYNYIKTSDIVSSRHTTWNYLGSAGIKGSSLTVPASAIHVLCIIQDGYSQPRTASLDLYPGISKSGYYAIGAYYYNGAGLGAQIKWDDTNRQVSFYAHYTDAQVQNSGVTLYVYYR